MRTNDYKMQEGKWGKTAKVNGDNYVSLTDRPTGNPEGCVQEMEKGRETVSIGNNNTMIGMETYLSVTFS